MDEKYPYMRPGVGTNARMGDPSLLPMVAPISMQIPLGHPLNRVGRPRKPLTRAQKDRNNLKARARYAECKHLRLLAAPNPWAGLGAGAQGYYGGRRRRY